MQSIRRRAQRTWTEPGERLVDFLKGMAWQRVFQVPGTHRGDTRPIGRWQWLRMELQSGSVLQNLRARPDYNICSQGPIIPRSARSPRNVFLLS